MEHDDLLAYLVLETKFKPNEFGSSSVTFKADGIHLTIFRAGKKIKEKPSSHILHGLSEEDAILFAKTVQLQCVKNRENNASVVSAEDRLTAMMVKKKTDSKDNQDEWN